MKVVSYTYFDEKVVRLETDDQKAIDQATAMKGLVEYKNVRLFDCTEMEIP